ncbi:DUF6708 domain-containing protein [Enterobacter mori]|uniref:DUF6708 domain-containing protein n=1 Tax=Enterobacter mori TaxID=539813 RepID=UPI002FD0CCBA
MFKRIPLDPSRMYMNTFTRITDKTVLQRYSREKGNSGVTAVSAMDSVIRINSTCLELVDRLYFSRGSGTLIASFFFSLFFGVCFLWLVFKAFFLGQGENTPWGVLSIIWIIFVLPLSWLSYKFLVLEVFNYTHYPIRFNRKNKTVYLFRNGKPVLVVPWHDLEFVRISNGGKPESWSIVGCTLADDGETVIHYIPLPVSNNWGPEYLEVYWEYIRCYMEEDDCVADLADIVTYCLPVEKQKEGWFFGLLYISKMTSRLGWLVNLPLFPFVFFVSITRWLVMLTCRIPVWPPEVEEACRPDENDPVNKGAEHNPPQVWRPMLAVQGKKRYEENYARERGAMDRIIARLKAKYPPTVQPEKRREKRKHV